MAMTHTRTTRIQLPQMALGGLSENWLFKESGDLHWDMISSHMGVAIDEVRDAQGTRLLPVFARISVDASEPIGSFKENAVCELTGSASPVDDMTFISDVVLRSGSKRIDVRLMTFFAQRTRDNGLIPGRPPRSAMPAPVRAHEGHSAFHDEFMALRRDKRSCEWAPGFSCIYELNPYYDVNGACLLYFASYAPIHDFCERRYIHGLARARGMRMDADWGLEASTLTRDVFYFGNCRVNDSLVFELDACEPTSDGRIRVASSIFRKSDGVRIARTFVVKQLES